MTATAESIGHHARAFSGASRLSTVAEGIIVAIAESPTVTLITESGKRLHWMAHLVEVGEQASDEEVTARSGLRPGHSRRLNDVWGVLEKINRLHPDQFKTGQDHLSPAFRDVDFRAAFSALVELVNEIEEASGYAGRTAGFEVDTDRVVVKDRG